MNKKTRNYLGLIVISVIVVITISFPSYGDETRYKAAGFIRNGRGEECWYTQIIDRNNTYFHDILNTIGILTFDDLTCMSDSEFDQSINILMINNIITLWYSHDDAYFKTRYDELYPGSRWQKRGYCIQSRTYSEIGITVDYEIINESIVTVRHGYSIEGCKK